MNLEFMELQNGFEKSKHFTDTPQSIKRQKEHEGEYIPSCGSKKGQSEKRKHKTGIVDQSVPRASNQRPIKERKRTPSVYTMAAF